jgi:hypothetical protein
MHGLSQKQPVALSQYAKSAKSPPHVPTHDYETYLVVDEIGKVQLMADITDGQYVKPVRIVAFKHWRRLVAGRYRRRCAGNVGTGHTQGRAVVSIGGVVH